ncbi:hypothetical protein SLEP1_g679 [Rubroshorea leprosula]|uniref:Uncharacterized protein n=1 Tax=Rubroshorea leprosula TaxID=152421 RepID=A0AAV5HM80_9ROSI|nr:hypothetical protein SLEP1_g679 [Rubroshorea leprosula]
MIGHFDEFSILEFGLWRVFISVQVDMKGVEVEEAEAMAIAVEGWVAGQGVVATEA